MKDITNILVAYEKFIQAGIDFQSLCDEDGIPGPWRTQGLFEPS